MRVIAGETTFGDLEETGSRPGWNDPAPQDVLDVFYLTGPNDIYGIESQPGDPGYSWLS